MNSQLGIELGARTIRGVRLEGWPRRRARVAEVAWDGERDNLASAVDSLLQHLGSAPRLGVALELSLLFVKQVKLPPVPAQDKANIIRVEPERFFPVRAEDLIPLARAEDDLVFAARETSFAAWLAALEKLGAVDHIEPGPVALSRALASARVTDGTAIVSQDGSNGSSGIALIQIRAGRVAHARRIFGAFTDAVAAIEGQVGGAVYLEPWNDSYAATLRAQFPDTPVLPLPSTGNDAVPSRFLPAYGAALGVGRANRDVLHSAELGARITSRRRRETAMAAVACTAALLFVLLSADGWRARTKQALDSGLQALNARATPALALQSQLTTLQRQSEAVARVDAQRSEPLQVLLLLSQRLPRDVYLRTISSSGAEWRLEGFAPHAAHVLGLLDGVSGFQAVHFLSATNRVVMGNRTYESFALAFRYTPAS